LSELQCTCTFTPVIQTSYRGISHCQSCCPHPKSGRPIAFRWCHQFQNNVIFVGEASRGRMTENATLMYKWLLFKRLNREFVTLRWNIYIHRILIHIIHVFFFKYNCSLYSSVKVTPKLFPLKPENKYDVSSRKETKFFHKKNVASLLFI